MSKSNMMTGIWKPISAENSAIAAPVYSELISELYGSSWYGRLSSAEIDYYRRYIQGGTTLELGCGTGRLLIPLFQAGCDIYGMDISAPMLERLQEKLPADECHRVIQWNALNVPYPIDDGSLDLITVPFSSFSLMHDGYIDRVDENIAFREFYRILRSGGLVILNDARTYIHDKAGGSAAIAQQ
ncbi:class I SAM-dependent methyltransferase [Coleofasciculus sp. F4-SAH-05]|uniref:class I SAM-dependent methyltransferase n=1 Tax=Coleofasciculus sp. F4-SAH-05 TaxID=3069525 RepID=UPI0032FA56C8